MRHSLGARSLHRDEHAARNILIRVLPGTTTATRDVTCVAARNKKILGFVIPQSKKKTGHKCRISEYPASFGLASLDFDSNIGL